MSKKGQHYLRKLHPHYSQRQNQPNLSAAKGSKPQTQSMSPMGLECGSQWKTLCWEHLLKGSAPLPSQ